MRRHLGTGSSYLFQSGYLILSFLSCWLWKWLGDVSLALTLDMDHTTLKKKAWYLIAMLLKLAFCLALCAKLEQFTTMNLSYVFIPLWALLAGALIELGYNVFFVRDWLLRTSSHFIVLQQTIIKVFWILASLKNAREQKSTKCNFILLP